MAVQNVNVDASPSSSLPLPTGAATAANQVVVGVAGTPSSQVVSIQGVAGGTAVPVSATISPVFNTRSDTYTTTTSGTTVNASTAPVQSFTIQVKGTGASATLWDVRLEGSLDNVNFTQVLQHTNTTGDGAVLYSGATLYPNLYFRSRCAGLTLGSATNIVVTILGVA